MCIRDSEEPVLKNYHTFMGKIYQGRYTAGVAAGMKMKELIKEGVITEQQLSLIHIFIDKDGKSAVIRSNPQSAFLIRIQTVHGFYRFIFNGSMNMNR